MCFVSYIVFKFLINTIEKKELPGVELGTTGLLDVGCPTEPCMAIDPRTHIYIYMFIHLEITFNIHML